MLGLCKMDSSIELKSEVDNLKDKCKSILKECEKWKAHPEAIFFHGYAEEKAERMLDRIRTVKDRLR